MAVGDLERRGRADGRGAGILGRAVARDDLDARMATQPRGDGRSRAVGQEVDRAPAIQVDQDRAIGSAFADGPVVKTNDPRWIGGRQREAVDEA